MINLRTKFVTFGGWLFLGSVAALLYPIGTWGYNYLDPKPEPSPETKSEQFDVACFNGGHLTFQDVIVASPETPVEVWGGGLLRGTTTDGFTIWAHSCVVTPIDYGE